MKAMTQANQIIKQSLQNRLAGWLNWSMQTLNEINLTADSCCRRDAS